MPEILKVLTAPLRSRWVAWVVLTLGIVLLFARFYRSESVAHSTLLRYYYDLYYLPYLDGKLPWRDFSFEYPPLAMIFIFGFGLFVRAGSYEQFVLLKSLFSGILLAASMGYFAQYEILRRGTWTRSLLCVTVLHLVSNLLVATFDGVVFAAIMAGSAMLLSGQRMRGSVPLLASAFVKVMPVLALPAMFKILSRKERWKFLGWVAALAGVNVWFLATGWEGFLNAFRYHSTRTIDAYSLWGALDMVLQKVGLSGGECAWKFGTVTVIGPTAEVLTKVATLTLLSAVGALYWNASQVRSRSNDEKAVWLVIATTVAFVLFGKLGQPNYAIWVAACGAVAMVAFPTSLRKEALMWVLLIGYAVLTTLIQRRFVGIAERTPGWAELMLAFGRSSLLVGFFVGMVSLWRQPALRAVVTPVEQRELVEPDGAYVS